jgi:hypothetical protein
MQATVEEPCRDMFEFGREEEFAILVCRPFGGRDYPPEGVIWLIPVQQVNTNVFQSAFLQLVANIVRHSASICVLDAGGHSRSS